MGVRMEDLSPPKLKHYLSDRKRPVKGRARPDKPYRLHITMIGKTDKLGNKMVWKQSYKRLEDRAEARAGIEASLRLVWPSLEFRVEV